MKTKLLKRIRNEKRFLVEHRGYVGGYQYSGWWYCEDLKMKKTVRHKRLKNVLHWLVKVYEWQFGLKCFAYSFLSGLLFVFLFHIMQLINQSK